LQPVVLPADRHRADVECLHALGRVEQRLVLADALAAFVHRLANGRGEGLWHGGASWLAYVLTVRLTGHRDKGAALLGVPLVRLSPGAQPGHTLADQGSWPRTVKRSPSGPSAASRGALRLAGAGPRSCPARHRFGDA